MIQARAPWGTVLAVFGVVYACVVLCVAGGALACCLGQAKPTKGRNCFSTASCRPSAMHRPAALRCLSRPCVLCVCVLVPTFCAMRLGLCVLLCARLHGFMCVLCERSWVFARPRLSWLQGYKARRSRPWSAGLWCGLAH